MAPDDMLALETIPCKSIKSLPNRLLVLEEAMNREYLLNGPRSRGYIIKRRELAAWSAPGMWRLAGKIVDKLYATEYLVRKRNPDHEHVRQRDDLIAALTVLIGVIYTTAYDIAPLSSWGPNSIANLLPLYSNQSRLHNYNRLNLFRQFFHNGVAPAIATDLVRNWYLLQPRNRACFAEKGTKVDRELANMAKIAQAGIGNFWTAWRDKPYAAWDVNCECYRQSNHFYEWPASDGCIEWTK